MQQSAFESRSTPMCFAQHMPELVSDVFHFGEGIWGTRKYIGDILDHWSQKCLRERYKGVQPGDTSDQFGPTLGETLWLRT